MTDPTELIEQPAVTPRRADLLQIDTGPRDDPFEATLVLSTAGPQPTAVLLTLTPTVLGDLITALGQVKSAQLDQLGIHPGENPSATAGADRADSHPHDEQNSTGLQRLHRAADPLGLRHLRGRKASPAILAALALAFLVLALILQVVQR